MNLGLIVSFLAPALAGAAVTHGIWRRDARPDAPGDPRAGQLLVIALALPLGLGLCSCLFFLWLVVFGSPGAGFAVTELIVAAGLAVMLLRGGRARTVVSASTDRLANGAATVGAIARLLPYAVAAAGVCALAGFAITWLRNPHGEWDAWMTWNLGARFLFRGGEQWTLAFSDVLRHPDYPLLLQGSVARVWYYVGSDTAAAPGAIGFVFTAATVALTWSAVALLRSRSQAHLAALALLGTTFLVLHGASQYADVPVGFFFLAAVVLFWLHDWHPEANGFVVLAGVMAGLGGWTKNEGLLFLPALAAARCAAVWRLGGLRRSVREMTWFALGAVPVLLIVLYFKLQLAPSNYLFSPEDHGIEATLGRLLDWGRYRFLAGALITELRTFGDTRLAGPIWVVAAYLLCAGAVRRPIGEPALRMTFVTACLIAVGHFLVLLIAPGDMPRLVNASLNRLLLQLWPVVVFTCFMAAAALGERGQAALVPEQR